MSTVTVEEILKAIDFFSPFCYAYEWDNCGLIIGSRAREVRKIAVSLDLDIKCVEKAVQEKCNCIVTHHPLIFHPIKRIDFSSYTGKLIEKVIQFGINVIAAHTNWDTSPDGGNKFLASQLGLVELGPISLPRPNLPSPSWDGVIGKLRFPVDTEALAEEIKARGGFSWVKYYGDCPNINSVAVCEGSGGDLWQEALKVGASAFVTAELKHHQIQEALDAGLSLIELSHAQMEDLTMQALAEKIKAHVGVDVVLLTGAFKEEKIIYKC